MSTVIEQRHGPVAVVTLSRPEVLNALNRELVGELAATFTAIEEDPSVRVVVLTGAGEAFCAGGDLTEAEWTAGSFESFDVGYALTPLIRRLPPVIAAIDGWAAGGGLELALACDLRFGSDRARFAAPEVGVGMVVGSGSSLLLRAVIGLGNANELVLRGDARDAAWALRTGLITEVLPLDGFLGHVLRLAERLADRAPLAVRESKRLMNADLDQPLEAAIERELSAASTLAATWDAAEGASAFRERRKPAFQGR